MTSAEMLDTTTDLPAGKTGCLVIPKWDEGHAQVNWDKNDPKDVEVARAAFVKQKALGYMAYRVDPKSGGQGAVLKEFDPSAEKVILVPPFSGG